MKKYLTLLVAVGIFGVLALALWQRGSSPLTPVPTAPVTAPAATTPALSTVRIAPAPTTPAMGALVRHITAPGCKVQIAGTSTLHDWTMDGTVISGFFEVDTAALDRGTPAPLGAVAEIKIPVRSLKSGKDKMDEIMQEHMKMEQFTMIQYRLESLTIQGGAASRVDCTSTGKLCIAGVTNALIMPVTVETLADGRRRISGSAPLKMTGFQLAPPVVSIGGMPVIKTGDDIKVSFEWMVGVKK